MMLQVLHAEMHDGFVIHWCNCALSTNRLSTDMWDFLSFCDVGYKCHTLKVIWHYVIIQHAFATFIQIGVVLYSQSYFMYI